LSSQVGSLHVSLSFSANTLFFRSETDWASASVILWKAVLVGSGPRWFPLAWRRVARTIYVFLRFRRKVICKKDFQAVISTDWDEDFFPKSFFKVNSPGTATSLTKQPKQRKKLKMSTIDDCLFGKSG
jgi:hypothetical protein